LSYIDDYNNLTLESLNEYVVIGQEEHIYLDFKHLNDAKMAYRDDRKNLAIALSGFANSSGG